MAIDSTVGRILWSGSVAIPQLGPKPSWCRIREDRDGELHVEICNGGVWFPPTRHVIAYGVFAAWQSETQRELDAARLGQQPEVPLTFMSSDPYDPKWRFAFEEEGGHEGLITLAQQSLTSTSPTAQVAKVRAALDFNTTEARWAHAALGFILSKRDAKARL